ncbi:MAG TPA: TetR/AcrR family transcriptional regulator [Candidatus Nesterenkonia stercoripullorum]|uniref:TetR/AcrR family transcriptional regulator n=1 Tax=Candidatus Nesterenkonia stercoripullorum TaxID=2838701 RepID=A0A9D1RZN6_9MICC|nr:TetR/AcrR family transcriptional regulator [Candidatus Nesterenkonia stercoripullorum]
MHTQESPQASAQASGGHPAEGPGPEEAAASPPAPVSQRERNRRETWDAIHTAAHAIALQDGPEGATVEQIAAAAGVSRRTFFNYFPTKEDAILGTQLPTMTSEIAERYRGSSRDELNRVVHLFAAVVRTSLPPQSIAARREAVHAHPELRNRLIHLLSHVEELVREVVTQEQPEGDPALRPALMMLAGTITKYGFSQYAESAVDDFESQLEHAIATFRRVLEVTS